MWMNDDDEGVGGEIEIYRSSSSELATKGILTCMCCRYTYVVQDIYTKSKRY